MSISIRAAGEWAAVNATTQTVTLPTHQAGDMLIVRAACKPYNATITCSTAGWNPVGNQYANGSTANGNGVGSLAFRSFYKVATSSSETDPVIDWGTTAAPGGAVAISYQKTQPGWEAPVGAGGGDSTARTAHTATISSHISVTAGDMVDFWSAWCDNYAATVPSITQTGVTFGAVTEYPATALSSGTSNDMAADGGYRLASSGTSSAAAVVTGTFGNAEQGGSWQTRLRESLTQTVTLALLDPVSAIYAVVLAGSQTIALELLHGGGGNDYESVILSDSPTFVLPMDESSGDLTDIVGSKTAAAAGTPTYGVTGPVTGHTAIDINASGDYFTVTDHADLDLGTGGFSIEFFGTRDAAALAYKLALGKGTNGYGAGLNDNALPLLAQNLTATLAYADTAPPSDGSWHHYVWTVAANPSTTGDYKLYVDGVLQTLTFETYAPDLVDNNDPLIVGDEAPSSAPWLGKLAYVALYKSVLSSTRIAAHYAARNETGGGAGSAIFDITVEAAAGPSPQTVNLALLDPASAIYDVTPTPGPVTVSLALLDPASAVYDITLTPVNTIALALLDPASAIFDITPTPGPATITLALLDPASSVFDITVSPGPVTVALDLIDPASAVFDITLTPVNTLTLDLLDPVSGVFDIALSPGPVTIGLALIDPVSGIFDIAVTNAAGAPQDVALGLLDPASAIYPVTLTPINTISLGLLDPSSAIYDITVTPGPATITLSLLDSGSAIYAVSVTAGIIRYIAPNGDDTNGDGSIGDPWLTFQKFIDQDPPAGSTLYVRGGTYTNPDASWSGQTNGVLLGTSGAPITIRAYPGEVPVFDGNTSSGLVLGFAPGGTNGDQPGSTYVIVEDLRFENVTADESGAFVIGTFAGQAGADYAYCSHITIRRCYVSLTQASSRTGHCAYAKKFAEEVTFEDCEFVGPYYPTSATDMGGGWGVHVYSGTTNGPRAIKVRRTLARGFQNDACCGVGYWDDAATGEIVHCTFEDNVQDIKAEYHGTLLIQDNAFDSPSGDGAIHDPNDYADTTLDSNHFSQTFVGDNRYPALGQTALGGAHDGSDAGWKQVEYISLDLLDPSSTIYGITVSPAAATVTLALIDPVSAVYDITVTPGPVTVTLDLLDPGADIFAITPSQASGTQDLVLEFIDPTTEIFAITVDPAPVTIDLALIDSTADIFAITPSAVSTISLDLLDPASGLYDITLTPGPVTISLDLLDPVSEVYAVSVGSFSTITLTLLDPGAGVFAITLQAGPVTLALDLLDPELEVYDITLQLATGPQTITLGLLDPISDIWPITLTQPGAITPDIVVHRTANPLHRIKKGVPGSAVVAQSLMNDLVARYGQTNGARIYFEMEALARGPFAPGNKYDVTARKPPPPPASIARRMFSSHPAPIRPAPKVPPPPAPATARSIAAAPRAPAPAPLRPLRLGAVKGTR